MHHDKGEGGEGVEGGVVKYHAYPPSRSQSAVNIEQADGVLQRTVLKRWVTVRHLDNWVLQDSLARRAWVQIELSRWDVAMYERQGPEKCC